MTRFSDSADDSTSSMPLPEDRMLIASSSMSNVLMTALA